MVRKKINLIIGLDIGTTKVVTLIGEVYNSNKIKLIGVGTCPSRGLDKGIVSNINSTVESIQQSISEAENMSGYTVNSVHVGIAGSHIKGINSNGIVPINKNEVTQNDIDKLIETAKAIDISSNRKILHILPQEFILDNQRNIKDPIGMSGTRLEGKIHIITGSISATQNIIKCVEKCDLFVKNLILEQIASSNSVLTSDEKELGVCLIDIGGGTTDLAIFYKGSIRYTSTIPIAGNLVTNDIAIALKISIKDAEKIKLNSSLLIHKKIDSNIKNNIEDNLNTRNFDLFLSKIIEARYKDILFLIKKEIEKSGYKNSIISGIVLTGGGAKIKGCSDFFEKNFKLPVRIGLPNKFSGLEEIISDPIYSTSIGILQFANFQKNSINTNTSLSLTKKIFKKMKYWFQSSW